MTFEEHLRILDQFMIDTHAPKDWRLAFLINYINWYEEYHVMDQKFQELMKEIT